MFNIDYIKNNSFPKDTRALIDGPDFIPDLTGFENLKLLASIQNKINDDKIMESLKKVNLYNDKDKPYQFPLFRDKDIGIYEYWQAHIVESKVDEDIDTDDEQLQIANSYNISELKEGIKEIREKGFEQLENKKLPRCSK